MEDDQVIQLKEKESGEPKDTLSIEETPLRNEPSGPSVTHVVELAVPYAKETS